MMEAHEYRAREVLASVVMRKLASPLLSKHISGHNARAIMQVMCNNGCVVHVIPIGYDEESS